MRSFLFSILPLSLLLVVVVASVPNNDKRAPRRLREVRRLSDILSLDSKSPSSPERDHPFGRNKRRNAYEMNGRTYFVKKEEPLVIDRRSTHKQYKGKKSVNKIHNSPKYDWNRVLKNARNAVSDNGKRRVREANDANMKKSKSSKKSSSSNDHSYTYESRKDLRGRDLVRNGHKYGGNRKLHGKGGKSDSSRSSSNNQSYL